MVRMSRAVPRLRLLFTLVLLGTSASAQPAPATPAPPRFTAVRVGRLVDPATGTVTTDQIILIKDRKFEAVGSKVAIPEGAEVIDLSGLTALPVFKQKGVMTPGAFFHGGPVNGLVR